MTHMTKKLGDGEVMLYGREDLIYAIGGNAPSEAAMLELKDGLVEFGKSRSSRAAYMHIVLDSSSETMPQGSRRRHDARRVLRHHARVAQYHSHQSVRQCAGCAYVDAFSLSNTSVSNCREYQRQPSLVTPVRGEQELR